MVTGVTGVTDVAGEVVASDVAFATISSVAVTTVSVVSVNKVIFPITLAVVAAPVAVGKLVVVSSVVALANVVVSPLVAGAKLVNVGFLVVFSAVIRGDSCKTADVDILSVLSAVMATSTNTMESNTMHSALNRCLLFNVIFCRKIVYDIVDVPIDFFTFSTYIITRSPIQIV